LEQDLCAQICSNGRFRAPEFNEVGDSCIRTDLLWIEGLDDLDEAVDSDESEQRLWALEFLPLVPCSYSSNVLERRRSSGATAIPTVQRT
jgi:hypothetical protein